jgi:hypothetical protein
MSIASMPWLVWALLIKRVWHWGCITLQQCLAFITVTLFVCVSNLALFLVRGLVSLMLGA